MILKELEKNGFLIIMFRNKSFEIHTNNKKMFHELKLNQMKFL